MKLSRKMKKFFLSILTVTLSLIMVVTSASATNAISYSEIVERDGVIYAIESITWDPTRDWFIFAVDLTCDEIDNVDEVNVIVDMYASYMHMYGPHGMCDGENIDGEYTINSEDTWDSDEICFSFADFSYGNTKNDNDDDNDHICHRISIEGTVAYTISFNDGSTEHFYYEYLINVNIYNEEFDYTRE